MPVQAEFEKAGGTFVTPYADFVVKASKIKAVFFDWDGVFNSGTKGEGISSSYTETDSMGLNMLRLSYWLSNRKVPFLGVITGQNNQSAIHLAKREHFHVVYSGFLNKRLAFDHLLAENGLQADEVAFVFDDILDIAIADVCGLRMAVNNHASPLFKSFLKENGLADYWTANKGADYAVREVCDLLIGLNGNYPETLKERIAFSEYYQQYLGERNAIVTQFYAAKDGGVVPS